MPRKCSCIEGALSFKKRPVLKLLRIERVFARRGCELSGAENRGTGAPVEPSLQEAQKMELSRMGRLAVLTTTVIFVLAGCGEKGSATLPESAAVAQAGHRSYKGSLLYIMSGGDKVDVRTYPGFKAVDSFEIPSTGSGIFGICSDSQGNVFVVTSNNGSYGTGSVYEYAHGSPNLVQTLQLSNFGAAGCAAVPVTGNLAVAGYTGRSSSQQASVAVFQHAEGQPTFYTWDRPHHAASDFCGGLVIS
jgi:predicted small lipoprotein YifL